jgi:hypothetical protein
MVPSGNALYLEADPAYLDAQGSQIIAEALHSKPDKPPHSMNRLAIIKEFVNFLRERKKWWIAPIVVILLLLGALLIFAKGSALAPFIYSLF